jgi:two-component system chemotaxis family response regulator WspR
LADKCRLNVEHLHIRHSASNTSEHVTISVGVASTIPQRGDTAFQQLIETADRALYEAKNTGKNRVVVREHQSIARIK